MNGSANENEESGKRSEEKYGSANENEGSRNDLTRNTDQPMKTRETISNKGNDQRQREVERSNATNKGTEDTTQ